MSGRRRGPQPDAPELRLLKGNPGKRRTPDAPPPVQPARIPAAPRELGKAGREAWRLYWTGGRAWLGLGDFERIRRACKLIDRAAAIEVAIEAEGFMIKNARTKRSAVHSAFNHLLGIYKAIADIEAGSGLPATERGRVRMDNHEGDELDQWARRRSGS